MATPAMKTANELALERTDLATTRSVMAADRSLMAWVRTALSMISFGFTIYKVLQGLQESAAPFHLESSPRTVGLYLTGLGTLSMVMGTVEYYFRLREFQKFETLRIWRPAFILALIMSGTGLTFFVSIIARLL